MGWWDAATGKPIALQDFGLTVYTTSANPVSVSADGLTLAVGGQGSYRGYFSVFRMDPETREVIRLLDKAGHSGTKRTLAISPDGSTVAISVYFSGGVYLYDTSTGKLLTYLSNAHSASVISLG